MITIDYDLKLLDSKFKKKYELKVRENDALNRKETKKMITLLKKEMDRAKNFIVYMYTVKNTYIHIRELIEPVVYPKFGKNITLQDINSTLDPDHLFIDLYESISEAVEEALVGALSLSYTD